MDYYEKEHRYMAVVDSPFVNLIIKEFVRQSKIKKHLKILEIGSGYGRFSIPLLKQGYNITLSDEHPLMVKKLRENIFSRNLKAKIVQLDITKKLAQEKYDLICGFHVLHHLSDVKKAFFNMKNSLKEEGKVAFVEPNPLNPLYYIQLMLIREMSWKGEKGILYMRNNYLKSILKRSNFPNIKIRYFGFFPNFIVNTKWGTFLEKLVNKIPKNPIGLYKMIIASKKHKI